MKFYSYEFLLHRNVGMNRVQLAIAAVLFIVLLVTGNPLLLLIVMGPCK